MSCSGYRILLPIALAALGLSAGSPSEAQTPPQPPAPKDAVPAEESPSPKILFRRVYVPEDDILEAAPEGFYPLARERFEQLAQVLAKEAAAPADLDRASLRRTEYYAALQGEHLRGHALIEIERRRPGVAAAALAPLNLAVSALFWKETGAVASAGLDAEQRYVVIAPREKLLAFSWSLGGTRDALGVTTFDVSLPACPVRMLTIDLPQELRLEGEGGLIEEREGRSSAPDELLSLAPPDPGTRRWRVEAAGGERLTLRVLPRTEQAPPTAGVRQSDTYDLSPEGLSLASELRLDVQGGELSELELKLDGELRPTAARIQERAVRMEVSPDDPSHVRLRFPESLPAGDHTVRVAGFAPMVLEQSWRLPRIRPIDAQWRSGQTDLRVSQALTLKKIDTAECVQTQVGPLVAGEPGRVLTFRSYSPSAELTLLVGREEARVEAVAGTSIDWGPLSASATAAFRLHAHRGSRFLLKANIAPEWILDSVSVTPAAGEPGRPAVAEDLVDRISIPAPGAPREPLEIRLKQSLRPDREMLLTLKAHRRIAGEGAVLTRSDLRVAELKDVEETARYIAVEPESPYQVVLADDAGVTLLDPSQLPPQAAGLVTASAAGVVFAESDPAGSVLATLAAASPNFSADIAMTAAVEDAAVRESYRIRISPISSRIETVQVHFSHGRKEDLAWKWGDASERAIAARRIATEGNEEGETWELEFGRPRDSAVTVLAERTTELNSSCELAFASLPQANSQQGELEVVAAPGARVRLRTQGLKPTPADAPPPGAYSTTYGAFRYEPAQQPAATIELAGARSAAPEAWAPSFELTSSYPLDGAVQHVLRMQVENRGCPAMTVLLPDGVTLRRIVVEEEEIAPKAVASGGWRIPLPPRVRHPGVTVEYSERRHRMGRVETLAPPAPQLDLPVLSRVWTVRLAPGLRIASAGADEAPSVEDPSWDDRLFGPLRGGERPQWIFRSGGFQPPTRAERSAISGDGKPPLRAWGGNSQVLRVAWPPGESPTVRVYRSEFFQGLAICVFFAAAVIFAWATANRPSRLWLVAGGMGAAALLAPPPYSVLCTALFLSVPTAAMLLLVGGRRRAAPAPTPRQSGSHAVSLSTVARAILFAAAVAGAAAGAAFGQPERAPPNPVHPVLIPLDEQGRVSTTDKYVYLSETLYRALHQAARRLETPPRPWILRSAGYRAVLSWGVGGEEIVCDRVEADLELEVLSAPANVALPLAWGEFAAAPESVRLDGAALDYSWEGPNGALTFRAEETGVFRIEVDAQPLVRSEDEQQRIDLPIPPLPQSTLRVQYPGAIEELEIAALGPIERDDASHELAAELGPVSRLAVAWPSDPESSLRPRGVPHVEQFRWLHVQPDALVLDAKWRFLGSGQRIDHIDVLTDADLTLLPSASADLAGFSHVQRGDKQALRLEFDEPRQTPFDFQVSFVVEGAVGVGRPHAPWLEIQDADVVRQWLAVSLDPTLEASDIATEHVEPLEERRFGAEWGEAPAPPTLAYRLMNEDAEWSAQTRFRPARATGQARVSVAFRRGFARATYTAELDAGPGHFLAFQLTTPADFRVEAASVVENGAERLDDWAQDGKGNLTLFLDGRLSGACRIEVTGRASTPSRGRFAAPHLALSGVDRLETTYRVYRGSDVMLRLVESEGAAPLPDAALGEYEPPMGRLAAAVTYAAGEASKPPQIVVEAAPNRPRTQGRQLVASLIPRDDAWIVHVDLEFQVSQGVVDAVRLEVPEQMAGPFTVDPPGRLESRELRRLGRRLIVFHPNQPWTDTADDSAAHSAKVRLRGFVRAAPGESLRAPNIELLDLGEATQFFVLPLQWQGQPIAWEPYGLRAEPPPLPLDAAEIPGPTAAYRVVNRPRFGAVVRQVEPVVGDPQIRLVDIRAAFEDDDNFYALATFDLEPAGLRQCVLELPPETQLIHAAVEGLATAPARMSEQRYAFDFGGRRLPLRLSVVYAGRASEEGDSSRVSVPAPRLLDLPVERTLWMVYPRAGAEALPVVERWRLVSPQRQELLRLRAITGILDLPSDVEAEHSRQELQRWSLPWLRRWAQIRGRLAPEDLNVADRGADDPETGAPLLDTLDEERDALTQRYGIGDPPGGESAGIDASALILPFRVDGDARRSGVRAAFQGQAESLELLWRSPHAPARGERWAGAAALLMASLLLARLLRRREPAEWLLRWLPLACVAGGAAWMIWLSPWPLGAAIVALGCWLAVSPRWKAAGADDYSSVSTLRLRRS